MAANRGKVRVEGTSLIMISSKFNSASDILAAINLTCGPHGLRLRYCLAAPLVIIFTQLLSVAFVLDERKRGIIVPVHKEGYCE